MPDAATAYFERPSDDLPLLTHGRLVFGRYRLEKIAGRGGMGIVWRALDTKLERPVALKFLPDLFFLDHAARDDLKRETRRSLELTHPHIVRIYDFLEDEELAAISMEYIDGATLSQRRVEQERRFFECRQLEGWALSLCQALDYAHHTACCVHRDLKPGNIMVTARGVLKVADFGISCGLQNTAARVSIFTSTGGTLGYMSPQQLAGELASPADDVYSVGATLYELLTSKPPFYSGDLPYQIRENIPERATERRAKLGLSGDRIGPAWEETIQACLSKQPEERPASVMEIARRLGLTTGASSPVADCREEIPPTIIVRPKRVPARSFLQHPTVGQARHWALSHRRLLGAVGVLGLCTGIWFRPHPPAHSPSSPASMPYSAVMAQPVQPVQEVAKRIEAPATLSAGQPPQLPVPQPTASAQMAPPVQSISAAIKTSDAALLEAAESKETEVGAGEATGGKLEIATTPTGIPFRLWRGGFEGKDPAEAFSGVSPMVLEDLPAGFYRIEFAAEGMGERSFTVRVAAEGTTPMVQTFPHGTIKVTSQPSGAEVFCDEVLLGVAPLEVACLPGAHTLHTELGDRESRPRSITIKVDETVAQNFDFREGTKSAGTTTRRRTTNRKKPQPNTFVKIGRSITNFFSGGNGAKKR